MPILQRAIKLAPACGARAALTQITRRLNVRVAVAAMRRYHPSVDVHERRTIMVADANERDAACPRRRGPNRPSKFHKERRRSGFAWRCRSCVGTRPTNSSGTAGADGRAKSDTARRHVASRYSRPAVSNLLQGIGASSRGRDDAILCRVGPQRLKRHGRDAALSVRHV